MQHFEPEGGETPVWADGRKELSCAPYNVRTSRKQFQIMIDFMEKEGDLSKLSQASYKRVLAWERLRRLLNGTADSEGHSRSINRWKKVWSDLKNNTKRKAMRLVRAKGAATSTLSHIEYRVLKLMNMIKSTMSAPPGGPAPRPPVLKAVPKPTLLVITSDLQAQDTFEPRADTSPAQDKSVDEEMFSWPKSPSPMLEENNELLEVHPPAVEYVDPEHHRASGETGETGETGEAGEGIEPGIPRPDSSGHTTTRNVAWSGRRRGVARALLRAEARRARESLRMQRRWQSLAREGLRLLERLVDRTILARAHPPTEAPEEVEDMEPDTGRLVLHPDRDLSSPPLSPY